MTHAGRGDPLRHSFCEEEHKVKITEMNNDQAAAALLRIAGPFASIADDEEVMAMLDQIKAMREGGVPVNQATMKMLPKFVIFGLSRHKKDIYEIIGALAMKPTTEVAKMNILETVQILRESFDEVFAGFFPSSAGRQQKSGGKSSAKSSGTVGTAGTS